MKTLSSPYLQEIKPRGLLENLMVLMRFVTMALLIALFAYILKLLLGFVTPYIHDNVFLQLKGKLYEKYFPFSLICLSIFALLITYNIFSFISGRSLVRSAYIRLMRRLLYVSGFEKIVMLMVRMASYFGLKPKLVENIVTTDCGHYLDDLTHNPDDQGNCKLLVSVSKLLPEITQLTQPEVGQQLRNVEMMLRSIILFKLRTGNSPYAKEIAVSGLKLIRLLNRETNTIDEAKPETLSGSFRFKDLLPHVEVVFSETARTGGAVDRLIADKAGLKKRFKGIVVLRKKVEQFLVELMASRELEWIRRGLYGGVQEKREARLKTLQKGDAAASDLKVEVLDDTSDKKMFAEEDVMHSHYQREKFFTNIALEVEECFFTEKARSMPELVEQIDGLVDKDTDTIRASGSLSHGIALYLSVKSGCDEISRSYKNSIEAFRFCVDLIDEGDSQLSQFKTRLINLTASLHEPWIQGLLAKRMKRNLATRSKDWADSVFKESVILNHEDFEYAAQQANSENMHAGPDYNGASSPPT